MGYDRGVNADELQQGKEKGKMKVCAINGSPKPEGNTAYALSLVLEELEKEGIET